MKCIACGGGGTVASWNNGPIWIACPYCDREATVLAAFEDE